jgi:hypothetical protein
VAVAPFYFLENVFELIIYSLFVWRVSSLLSREEGPYDLLERFRFRIGVRYDENSQRYGTTMISKAVLCLWCISVWVALLVSPLMSNSVNFHSYFINALALSAAAILVEENIK